MARPRSGEAVLRIPAPVSGVNLATSWDKMKPTEAAQLRGFEFDEYGVLGVPRAPKSLGTILASHRVLSAHVFQRAGSTTQLIVHLTDGSLRYSTDFLTTSGSATWNTIATGKSTSAPYDFVTFLDKVWMTNGTNDFAGWDGTTFTEYATVPKGKYLALWRDTLWMAGESANPHRVRSAVAGDPTTWDSLDFVDVAKGSGLGISSIFAVETALIVFKPQKTHIIFDPIEYTNRLIDDGKGCVSHYSVVSHNGLIYFASHVGICRFLGDGPSEVISTNIQPLFDDLFVMGSTLGTSLTEWAQEARIVGYSFENFVGWYIPSNLISPWIKCFPDLPDMPWVFGEPFDSAQTNPAACVSVKELGKVEQLYKMSGNPSVLEREYGGALTDVVSCEWLSAAFDMDAPLTEKYFSMFQVLHRGVLANVSIVPDYDVDNVEVIAPTLSHGETELQDSTIYADIYARAIQFFAQSSSAAELEQLIGSGLAGVGSVTRFQAGIAGVIVKARVLTDMYR